MKKFSFFRRDSNFFLLSALAAFLVSCATPSSTQPSYAFYHPTNIKLLNSEVKECKEKTIEVIGAQEGQFEIVTLISNKQISSSAKNAEQVVDEDDGDSYAKDEALKVLKAFGGMGLAVLGVLSGDILALDGGIKAMNNFDQNPKLPARLYDSQMVLNVFSSWEPAATEKTKACLSKLGYSFLSQ